LFSSPKFCVVLLHLFQVQSNTIRPCGTKLECRSVNICMSITGCDRNTRVAATRAAVNTKLRTNHFRRLWQDDCYGNAYVPTTDLTINSFLFAIKCNNTLLARLVAEPCRIISTEPRKFYLKKKKSVRTVTTFGH
jgi:hypothetical protein